MDIGTLRGLGTVVIMVAFIGLVIWAYSGKRKKSFDEATMLPFADDPEAALERLQLPHGETSPLAWLETGHD